jgi:hypothetical protein
VPPTEGERGRAREREAERGRERQSEGERGRAREREAERGGEREREKGWKEGGRYGVRVKHGQKNCQNDAFSLLPYVVQQKQHVTT